MRVKSSVLFGLIALLCVISGVSVYKQLREVHDSWQPSDMYTGLKGMRSRTYTSVSYGNGASSDAPVLSLGARSMLGHNAAFSYAHAPVSPAISMGSTSSYGQSAVAGGNPVYATSNAEVRSFGGGGNGGGSVSMSGGVAKSSGSGAGSSVSLGVSTPSAPILAVNNNRNTNNQILPNVSGEVVANPVATYAGIGNTTGGASRGIGGRKNAPGLGGNMDDWVQDIIGNDGWVWTDGTIDYFDKAKLYQMYQEAIANGNLPEGVTWEMFLSWFSNQSDRYAFPIPSGVWFMCFLALGYGLYSAYRRKQKVVNS